MRDMMWRECSNRIGREFGCSEMRDEEAANVQATGSKESISYIYADTWRLISETLLSPRKQATRGAEHH